MDSHNRPKHPETIRLRSEPEFRRLDQLSMRMSTDRLKVFLRDLEETPAVLARTQENREKTEATKFDGKRSREF